MFSKQKYGVIKKNDKKDQSFRNIWEPFFIFLFYFPFLQKREGSIWRARFCSSLLDRSRLPGQVVTIQTGAGRAQWASVWASNSCDRIVRRAERAADWLPSRVWERGRGSVLHSPNRERFEDASHFKRNYEKKQKIMEEVIHCFIHGTNDLKALLLQSCNLIFECRSCRELFRSLPDFVKHIGSGALSHISFLWILKIFFIFFFVF